MAVLFEDSHGTPVEAPLARTILPFGYANFGKPGAVATRKEVADLGITQIVLFTRTHIKLKRTDFEKGKIRLLARIGSGKLSQPMDMPMLDTFATALLEIREKLGASYSPNAGASGSDALDNMGSILSESVGKPEDMETLLNTMQELTDELAAKGATANELDRTLKPILGQLEQSLRDNSYWLGTVNARPLPA